MHAALLFSSRLWLHEEIHSCNENCGEHPGKHTDVTQAGNCPNQRSVNTDTYVVYRPDSVLIYSFKALIPADTL